MDIKLISKVFDEVIKFHIDEKCEDWENYEYTNSKGDKITIRVKQVKKPSTFTKHLREAVASQPPNTAWRVEVPDEEDMSENYENTRLYVTQNGSTIAVRDNGDIISVCANATGKKDSSSALLSYAVSKGGDRLDSFDGNYGFYIHCGFEPVSYVDFVEEFAPPNWVKGRDKAEPIIFFKYTGERSDYINPQQFYDKVPITADYDDAHLLRDNDIIYNSKKFKFRGDGSMVSKSKKYPLSSDEFEKKVIELLLEEYGDTPSRSERLLDLVDYLRDDDFFITLYSDSCYREDKYGNAFTDEELINQPVRLIMMFYED